MKDKKAAVWTVSIRGFTLIELIITLFIFSVLAAIAAPLLYRQTAVSREEEALSRLEAVKMAMIGDPARISEGERTDFGYLGDWGSLPDSLLDLVNPKTPAWQFDMGTRIGTGWNGPYIEIDPDDLIYNPWGDEYVYNTADYVNERGLSVDAVLISYGEDRVPSEDDQKVEILKSETTANWVRGYVTGEDKKPAQGIQVTINYPVNGSIAQISVFTDSYGYYGLSNIPYGVRTIFFNTSGAGGILYIDYSAITQQDDLEFRVKSSVTADITVTWLKAEYGVEAYYDRAEVGGHLIWDGVAGSGDIIYFESPVVVLGGGNSIRIAVRSLDICVPDMMNPIAVSDALTFELMNFEDSGGAAYGMAGEQITITFSDGSIIVFTPI